MRVIVLMGVSGSGKSTVGQLLARKIGGIFHDGDDFHPSENVDKMSSGVPLNDSDRTVWLAKLAELITQAEQPTVIACSALKQCYRDVLKGAQFIFLSGSPELLAERLAGRKDHYMPPALLLSQLETLEEPKDALRLDIQKSPEVLVKEIRTKLSL